MANHPNRGLPPLARSLKAWREREGLTREAACERYDVPLSVWRDWEQRGTSPRTHLAEVAGRIIAEAAGL